MIPQEITDKITEIEDFMENELGREPDHGHISKNVMFRWLKEHKPECSIIVKYLKAAKKNGNSEEYEFEFIDRQHMSDISKEFN